MSQTFKNDQNTQHKKDTSTVTHFVISSLIVILFISSVSAKEPLHTSNWVPQIIDRLTNNIAEDIDQDISNKEGFKLDFALWYDETSAKLEGILSDMSWAIKKYAESEESFDKQHQELVSDFSQIQTELNSVLDQYPQLDEVLSIAEPHMQEFEWLLTNRFPELGPIHKQGNPLGNLFQYYEEATQRNPFGMGSFFRIVYLPPEQRLLTLEEKIKETTIEGVKIEDVVFREVNQFTDGILVFHEKIVDGEIVETYKKLEDFSIIHGLPDKMRGDGINENIVLLIEEYIKLVNLHLNDAFENEGLEIPIDHPQLAVPPGYTSDIFIDNFSDILEALEQDFT